MITDKATELLLVFVVIMSNYIFAVALGSTIFPIACNYILINYKISGKTIRRFCEAGTKKKLIFWYVPPSPLELRIQRYYPKKSIIWILVSFLCFQCLIGIMPPLGFLLMMLRVNEIDALILLIALIIISLHVGSIYSVIATARELTTIEKQYSVN